jgi:hypothetical protein
MTGTDSTGGTRFNEQAALEELERLQRAIEASRRKRGQSVDAFDAFVRSFKTTTRTEEDVKTDAVPVLPPPPAPSTEAPPVTVQDVAPSESPEDVTSSATGIAASAPLDEPAPAVQGSTRPRWWVSGRTALVVGIGALIAAGAALMILPRRPPPATATVTQPVATPQALTSRPSVTAPSVPSAVGRDGLRVEFTAVKPVWVRVTVDGERALERELGAGDRVPFTAQHTIVIRAGNAGAVRVAIGGQDQGLLGREGDVVNRTFSQAAGRGKDR